MRHPRSFYIIAVQYLGFRFHGWQKQPDVNTVQRMVDRTLAYVFQHKKFKTLAASRTDAKVSANKAYFELFLDEQPIEDLDEFIKVFNKNLPQDIKASTITVTDEQFNIIQHPKIKEYVYIFSYGNKNHPFAAPFMVNFENDLDIKLMQKAAKLFEGTHDFRNYCYKPTSTTVTKGNIITCEIIENELYSANFFPEESYLLRVIGEGFKRNQIRLIMARLVQLGRQEYSFSEIQSSVNYPEIEFPITYIAPPSGLILHDVKLKNLNNS